MDMTIVGLIIIGVCGLGFGLFVLKESRDKSKNAPKAPQQKVKEAASQGKSGASIEHSVPRKDMFKFLEFDRIIDDMVLQENESRYTMVIQCKGINYDLMSDVEQLSVEEGFITFLNTLRFPIQIYVQARAINLKDSIDIYKNSLNEINNKYTEAAENFSKISNNIGSNEDQITEARNVRERYGNMLDYAKDITRYVERISLNKHMLQRKFYIVLSYYKSEVNATTSFTKEEIHEICHRELYTRAQSIISALLTCSVTAKVLTSNEVAELLYISYNRDDEKLIDVQTALDSGFYRLYSTTKDIYEKKQEVMEKEIKEEAMRRVKEAILESVDSGAIRSQEEMIEEYEEGADREAVRIIRDSDMEKETKDNLTNIIAEKHVAGVEQRKAARGKKENETNEKENSEKVETVEKKEEVKSSTENDSIV